MKVAILIFLFTMQLRLSEVVIGTRKIFLKLCAGNKASGLEAHITPESFYLGLHKVGVDVGEAESQQLFEALDRDKVG